MMHNLQLLDCSWQQKKTALSLVRRNVFIEEQQVPEELEWDEFDNLSHHILALIDHQPVATGRIKADGQIGRMAVLKEFRQQGIGSLILNALIDYARQQQYKNIYLHAQLSAIDFYTKHGFTICSDEFMDAGIPHKTMQKPL